MKRAVVAGGTGFVGRHLCQELANQGWEPVVLTRKIQSGASFRQVQWDGKNQGEWSAEINGADAVFNLSGAPVEQKWTPEYGQVICRSRVDSTAALHQAVSAAESKPRAWVNASAVGFYGDRGDEILGESARAGVGFLPDVCQAWERACLTPVIEGVKQVCVRNGHVLGADDGLLPVMLKLAKSFLGGAAGDGRQWMPMIHVRDLARFYIWCLDHANPGPINGCAPEPVTNTEFMAQLRMAVGRPFSPPVPKPLLEFGTGLVGMQGSLMTMSHRAVPILAQSLGFRWEFPTLESMLADLVK